MFTTTASQSQEENSQSANGSGIEESTSTGPPDGENDRGGDPAGTAESDRGELSLDLIFEILKNSRRREVLRYLKERRERVTLSDLAEHVAALENDTTVQALSSQQRKRVYVGLYQCHLPKLDDMDVIEFNQSRGHVELGPNAGQLDRYLYLDETKPTARPWPRYYVGFSAVGVLTLAGGVAAGAVGPVAAGLCVALLAGVTAIATFQARAEETPIVPRSG